MITKREGAVRADPIDHYVRALSDIPHAWRRLMRATLARGNDPRALGLPKLDPEGTTMLSGLLAQRASEPYQTKGEEDLWFYAEPGARMHRIVTEGEVWWEEVSAEHLRRSEQESNQQRAQEAEAKQQRYIDTFAGYTANMPPMQRGRVEKSLERLVHYPAPVGTASRADAIKAYIQMGAIRGSYTFIDHKKEPPIRKTKQVMFLPGGMSGVTSIGIPTKTEQDFFAYLQRKMGTPKPPQEPTSFSEAEAWFTSRPAHADVYFAQPVRQFKEHVDATKADGVSDALAHALTTLVESVDAFQEEVVHAARQGAPEGWLAQQKAAVGKRLADYTNNGVLRFSRAVFEDAAQEIDNMTSVLIDYGAP